MVHRGLHRGGVISRQDAPVVSDNQDGVLWVEGDLGEFGLFDNFLLTDSFMLLLSKIIHMHLHRGHEPSFNDGCLSVTGQATIQPVEDIANQPLGHVKGSRGIKTEACAAQGS